MVGEGLAEIDQSGRWGDIPPVEKVVKLEIENEQEGILSLQLHVRVHTCTRYLTCLMLNK